MGLAFFAKKNNNPAQWYWLLIWGFSPGMPTMFYFVLRGKPLKIAQLNPILDFFVGWTLWGSDFLSQHHAPIPYSTMFRLVFCSYGSEAANKVFLGFQKKTGETFLFKTHVFLPGGFFPATDQSSPNFGIRKLGCMLELKFEKFSALYARNLNFFQTWQSYFQCRTLWGTFFFQWQILDWGTTFRRDKTFWGRNLGSEDSQTDKYRYF